MVTPAQLFIQRLDEWEARCEERRHRMWSYKPPKPHAPMPERSAVGRFDAIDKKAAALPTAIGLRRSR